MTKRPTEFLVDLGDDTGRDVIKMHHDLVGWIEVLEARIAACASRLGEIVESGDEGVELLQDIEEEARILRGDPGQSPAPLTKGT